jgi:hypothetical protein
MSKQEIKDDPGSKETTEQSSSGQYGVHEMRTVDNFIPTTADVICSIAERPESILATRKLSLWKENSPATIKYMAEGKACRNKLQMLSVNSQIHSP